MFLQRKSVISSNRLQRVDRVVIQAPYYRYID